MKQNKQRYLIILLLTFFAIVGIHLYYPMLIHEEDFNIRVQCIEILTSIWTYIKVVISGTAAYYIFKFKREICVTIFKYRYLIAAILFAFCVFFELNGSSIGIWCQKYGVKDANLLLGISRLIRSDEWSVSTPMMLSQYYNAAGRFPYFSETIRGTLTDVFLEYGQPVKSIAMIFRPFYLGYLLFSSSKGISFFWVGRWIALFMVSFEMGRLVTKDNRILAVMYAFLIAFAPTVQWWFAINGLVEMLICLQLSIVMFWKYLNESKFLYKIIYSIVIMICAGTYVLTMYPAWQISLAWVLVALIIWVIAENYEIIKIRLQDTILIGIELIVMFGIIGYVVYQSWNTIKAITGTVYPGSRFETGGLDIYELFSYIPNIWASITEKGMAANVCESARFIDFFPICYVLPILVLFVDKNKDKFIMILIFFSLFLGVYCFIGFPSWLAKITLLSNCQAGRAIIAYEFINILLLIRSVAIIKAQIKYWVAILLSIICSSVGVLICKTYDFSIFNYKVAIVTMFIFGICTYCLLTRFRYGYILICLLMLFTGGLVNPIRKGVDCVNAIDRLKQIQEVQNQDTGALWVIDGDIPEGNLGIMVGAATVNSTNVYPDLDRWHLIDQSREYEDVYNRYAHIKIDIIESEHSEFELTSPDAFTLHISLDDLNKLGVKYISTDNDILEQYKTNCCIVKKVKDDERYNVYQIFNK
ncbi:MAG: hypothetical protein J6A03_04290 [Lachnospiraceae bacterium]|nr:hypothetical protein [Lachnospiraceae bacterium]